MVEENNQEKFSPTGLGETIFKERYARNSDETWEEACRRVASHIADAETNGKVNKYAEKFYEELVSNRFMPGGRIWYGAGRPKGQLLNCFVIPVDDSREGWGKMLYDTTVISGLGGGIGANYSKPRPRGFAIKGTGGVSTGAVSAMKMQDGIANELRQGGGRRAALMQCLNINHPDLEEFLHVKLDRQELENANISVVLNMPTEEFVRLVQEDGDIILEFNGLPTGETLKAKEVWETLVTNAWNSGEPGVLNGHLANKMNNIAYYEELISTNPCGEIWLGAYDCCDLGAIVLPRFVFDGEFDWDLFDASIRLAVRFLDNVLDVNHFPLPEIQEKCHLNRRLGAGVMGLHTMLLKLGLRYDSEEGFAFVNKLLEFYKNVAYDASCTLAAEKGPFPGFDREKYLQGGFAKTLKRGIRNKIKAHGLRNCALMTIAPTGTTSMVSGVTSGIEPLFAPVYWRRYRVSDEKGRDQKKQELVITDEFKEFGEIAVGAYDIPVEAHFEMQKIVQSHIDNAVSKTINLPKEYPLENLSDIWLKYLDSCKGTTIYRQGSRGEEPLEHIPVAEAKKIIEEQGIVFEGGTNFAELNSLECVGGVCDIPDLAEVASV
jgi:ribonucleoside-diphosphate reductase alpha chain